MKSLVLISLKCSPDSESEISLKIGQYLTQFRRKKQSVPVFGPPCIPTLVAPERIRKWGGMYGAERRNFFGRAPTLFDSTSTISRSGEPFRDGQMLHRVFPRALCSRRHWLTRLQQRPGRRKTPTTMHHASSVLANCTCIKRYKIGYIVLLLCCIFVTAKQPTVKIFN